MSDAREWTVEDHLTGAAPEHVALCRRVEELLLGMGDVHRSVSRTTITFVGTRRGFAGARPTSRGVRGYLDLTRTLPDDPRVTNVSPYTARLFVHQYLLRDETDLDDTFVGWLREAHAVGQGAHLRRPADPGARP
ncbi:DUF5655 domain-containing protein [Cellulomonas cellasea]|uniref:DUF5655 domain-containing protein n=2 Tax=Cellulomonas cellasea TaxID=43670 RepID=A0A0A0BBW5_9CELL|nr:DUF5655 domain-containing protein [Cellulomonas cellasea]KGM03582.1 hypothetical protein Q760_01385 [Cellulomonas cellasea DSM 20118]GEA89203.1 hypothetical protein CCE01nite_31520 [Cellulomonas cellasea]